MDSEKEPMLEKHDPEALEDAPPSSPAGGRPASSSPSAASASGTAAAGPHSQLTTLMSSLDWQSSCLLLGFFNLLVLVASASIEVDDGMEIYQIVAPAVSLVLVLTMAWCGARLNNIAKQVLSASLFILWLGTVIALTFFGSFKTTANANGYFGTWLSFLFSAVLFMSVSSFFQSQVNSQVGATRAPLTYLIITSAVVLGASVDYCIPPSPCLSEYAWALAASSISILVALIMLALGKFIGAKGLLWMSRFLVVWWVVGTMTMTYIGPFKMTGNGYFGCFAAFVSSMAVMSSAGKTVEGNKNSD